MTTPYLVGDEIMGYLSSEWSLSYTPTMAWVTDLKVVDGRKETIMFTPLSEGAEYYALGTTALRKEGGIAIDIFAPTREKAEEMLNEVMRILMAHVSGTNYRFLRDLNIEDSSRDFRRVYRYTLTVRFVYYEST